MIRPHSLVLVLLAAFQQAAFADPLAPTGRWSAYTAGRAATPPMGWSSWNAFGTDIDDDTILGGLGAEYLDGGADDDVLWSDAFDEVYGRSGRDFFDMNREDYTWANPRPGRYMDWGTV